MDAKRVCTTVNDMSGAVMHGCNFGPGGVVVSYAASASPSTSSKKPAYLLAVDVEASGMGLRSNFLIQIGLALVHVPTGHLLARFSSYVAQPPGTTWEKRCVDEFWSKHPEIYAKAQKGVADAPPAEHIAKSLMAWIRTHVVCPDQTRLITDTPGFDLAWLDWLLGDRSHLYLFETDDGKPMMTDVLDVSSWYLGIGKVCDPMESSKKAVLSVIKRPFPDFEFKHTHDAADDATLIAMRAAWVMRQI